MKRLVLEARSRDEFKNTKAKRLRRKGFIPAVIYGQNFETKNIALNRIETEKFFRSAGRNTVFEIDLAGEKILCILKHIQYDNMGVECLNIDLQAVSLSVEIRVTVPITIVGQENIERQGALLVYQTSEVEVECLPDDMVNHFEVDVSDMEIGTTYYIGDITLPESYKLISSPEEVVFSITVPKSADESDEEDEDDSVEEQGAPEEETKE